MAHPAGEQERDDSGLSGPQSKDSLVFMMGKFEATIPLDRRYVPNHMWCQPTPSDQHPNGRHRFGFSAYAVRLLQDVYFLEWSVDTGATVQFRQEIGSIESSKAESALYAPIAGQIARFNSSLLADPSAINLDNYGAGWLFEMQGDAGSTLAAEGYVTYLTDVWVVAQRTIKGQLH